MSDLSIVIPTRNRHQFLKQTVQVILSAVKNAEIIIVDNSDEPLRHDFLINGNQLQYVYTSEQLSVVGNFEKSLGYTSRRYVSFIGDDDLISDDLAQIIGVMDRDRLDSLYPWNNGYVAHFIWPGVQGEKGTLWLKDFDKNITIHPPCEAIERASRFPGKGPANLPKLYQGIVLQDVISKTRKAYGHVFGGVSPDIYSGLLLAANSKKSASMNYPFILPGASSASTAGEGVQKTDRDRNKANKDHVARFGHSLTWPRFIPDVYTPHTVWALSMFAALDTLSSSNNRKYLGFLYLEMLMKYPALYEEIKAAYLDTPCSSRLSQLLLGVKSLLEYYLPRIQRKLLPEKAGTRKIPFDSIVEIGGHLN
jgi:glycosyltransferase involved in cell wall biosynthesis